MNRILITGVSSGIGHGLARAYLDSGSRIYGISRRTPDDLVERDGFVFESLDLGETETIGSKLRQLLGDCEQLDLVILNAGVLGKFGDMFDAELDDLRNTMTVNVWSNKSVLDWLRRADVRISQVVAISSGASVNGNRGWSGYSISKAALNMLVKLYAREMPDTHLCALAPGLVDTEIQQQLCGLAAEGRFPSLDKMKKLRGTPEMPTPAHVSRSLIEVVYRLPSLVESGSYADIRQLLAL